MCNVFRNSSLDFENFNGGNESFMSFLSSGILFEIDAQVPIQHSTHFRKEILFTSFSGLFINNTNYVVSVSEMKRGQKYSCVSATMVWFWLVTQPLLMYTFEKHKEQQIVANRWKIRREKILVRS